MIEIENFSIGNNTDTVDIIEIKLKTDIWPSNPGVSQDEKPYYNLYLLQPGVEWGFSEGVSQDLVPQEVVQKASPIKSY